ncbi:hypothetical protein N9N67_05545 [Bacteriovoracaceae bacterium]|nr:hypothetical protein [Bacteriovoracaceae bacterium]
MNFKITFVLFVLLINAHYAHSQIGLQPPGSSFEFYDMSEESGRDDYFVLAKGPYNWSYLNDRNGGQFKNRFMGINILAGRKADNKKYLNFVYGITINESSSTTPSPTDPSYTLDRRASNLGGNVGYTISHDEKQLTTVSCDLSWGTDGYTDQAATNRDYSNSTSGFRYGFTVNHINQAWENRKNSHPHSGKIFANAQASFMKNDITTSRIYSAGFIAYPFTFGNSNAAGPYINGESNNSFNYKQKYFEVGFKSSFILGLGNVSAGMRYYKIDDILENTDYTGGCSFNITAGIDTGVLSGFLNALFRGELQNFKL